MIYIGIDPDLNNISAAVLDENNTLTIHYKKAPKIKGTQEEKVYRAIREIVGIAATIYNNTYYTIYMCIEGQNIRYTGRTNSVPSQSLIGTAQLSGAWCGALCSNFHNSGFYDMGTLQIVLPFTWKQNLSKKSCQSRAYDCLKIPYHIMGGEKPYAVPCDIKSLMSKDSDTPNPGDFVDISDSVALALYCKRKYGKITS